MKKRRLILGMVIGIVLLLTGWLFWRLHAGVRVNCVSEHKVNEQIIFYRQDNSEWGNDTLGNSSYTMKTSGCLVTCIASAISVNDSTITPGKMNALFTKNSIYDEDGNMQWDQMQKIDGLHVERYDDVSNDDIEHCLEEGRYPIVRVRRKGLGSYHYILIVGTDNGEYICMDPLEDRQMKLSEYGNFVYAVRCVW